VGMSAISSADTDGSSLWQVEKDLKECQESTRAISAAAETITQALSANAHSQQMERIFQVIDGFRDSVLPALDEDLKQLEGVVEELEQLHLKEVSPINAFFADVTSMFGAGVSVSETSTTTGNEKEENKSEAAMLLNKTEEIELKNSHYLIGLMIETKKKWKEEEEEEQEEEQEEEEDDSEEEDEEDDVEDRRKFDLL